jgi:hypothetical protein
MPIQVDGVLLHAISGTELSRVRTELYKLLILPSSSPHPVQENPQPASHGYFGNVPLPTHGQVSIMTSPSPHYSVRLPVLPPLARSATTNCPADVSQPLLAAAGVLTRNHPRITADLLGASEPRCKDKGSLLR